MAAEKKDEIKIFISNRSSTCGECGEDLGKKAWITLQGERGAACLSCADLDDLVYLPRGDAALTRRSKKYSPISAVVLQWSRSRKRYERQGLLVTEDALARAEEECLDDEEVRAAKRERNAERREVMDKKYIQAFSQKIRATFPAMPKGREKKIAEHACLKYSGRVGRSAMAKHLDEDAIHLAVQAHVRHQETNYMELLNQGYERFEARARVAGVVERTLAKWRG